ncbi:MAG TPA: sulfur carrier protein ThiS [Dehalococcoidia bacterium]|nr:sulfur carrier protein ThiS [Dehalococcoidia bacterium]
MITLTVNGKPRDLDQETPLLDFLTQFKLNPKAVAVEYNGEIAPRETYDRIVLKAGDRVEIVRMMGGG